jgi:adenylate cyclase
MTAKLVDITAHREPFRLSERCVRPSANEIDGERIEPKAMDVLVCLAGAAPEVVSSATLLEQVWPGVVVGDNVLHQAVAHLRRALGDIARSPRYIENIPRRGYRLLLRPVWDTAAPAQRRPDTGDVTAVQTDGGNEPNAGRSFRTSIAVLPFVNVSPEPDQAHFIDGLSEALINLLARNPELEVASRTSAFRFRDQATDLRTIARQLGVAHVLEGSVQRVGEQIRVSVQLIDARADRHLWSETFERRLGDVFALQDEIACRVFDKLHVMLLRPESARRAADVEAFLRFREARRELEHGHTGAVVKATRLLREAVAIDPSCTCGWIELARVSTRSGNQASPDLIARQAAEHNPQDPLVKAWLGVSAVTRALGECDLAAGAAFLRRALEANPTSEEVLHSTCVLLIRLGRLSEATRVCLWLLSRDPMCLVCRINLGQAYIAAQRLVDAERTLMATLAMAPDSLGARAWLAWSQLLQGKTRTALSTLENFVIPHPSFDFLRAFGLREFGDHDSFPEAVRRMEIEWGRRAYYLLVEAYTMLGDFDAAFHWLERSEDVPPGDLLYPHLKHQYAPLYGDPRWTAALERLGLLPEQLARIEFDVVLPARPIEPPIG